MSSIPLLQVALDYTSLPSALAMALRVAPEVDVIEIGTPLCKAAGMEAVRAVREVCPDKLILADVKSPDVGGLEAKNPVEGKGVEKLAQATNLDRVKVGRIGNDILISGYAAR